MCGVSECDKYYRRGQQMMTKPNYRMLYQFSKIATEGSFSAAADRLGVSQSTLSQQIAKLEGGLGKKLFHRNGRALSLTPIGSQLLRDIAGSFDRIDLAWSETRSNVDAKDSLIIASVHTLFTYFLPDILVNFLERTPQALPDICGRSSDEVISLALSRAIDFGLVYDTAHVHTELKSEILFQESIVAVFHPEAPWAQTLTECLEITPDIPLTVFQKGYALRSLLDRAYQKIPLNIMAETDNIELMLRIAQAKLGVALLPEGVIRQFGERRGLVSCKLHHSNLKWNVIAVWRGEEELRPLAKKFLSICRVDGNT